ncbi:Integrase, catalytic core [Corchorus capsularis]|uniref:Integrase, catalytic core n=1 Tax=Corchorus capsularis TaxID=210143 RepID=A0A1R3JQB9_COCAP|nr:Integrase, catalytic core [Corchorus capsularis]
MRNGKAILKEKPTAVTEDNTDDEKYLYESWERSNRLALNLMQMSMADTVKPSVPKTNNAREFMQKIKEYSQSDITDKSIVGSLMNFGQFQVNYNSLKEKWNFQEIKAMLVQEEGGLKNMKEQTVHLMMHEGDSSSKAEPGRKDKDKRKDNSSLKVKEGHVRKEMRCFFCKKIGHLKKDCPKRKAWFEKKGSKRSAHIENSAFLWHQRLGHISNERIMRLVKGDILPQLDFVDWDVERQLDRKVKVVRSYRGGEYYGKYDKSGQCPGPFAKFLESQGICAQYTMPGTPQQNGVAERRNRTLMEMVRSRKPSLRHLHVWGCPAEVRIYNPHEKKLDARTISGYFIDYPEKSKGYRFYYPNHSTRIVESGNASFIENGQFSGSGEQRKVDIKEIQGETPMSNDSHQVVVPLVVSQLHNVREQRIHVRNLQGEHEGVDPPNQQDEPANNTQVEIEQTVNEPQEVALRRSVRQRRPTISQDFEVYSIEHECDLSIDDDPVSFKQAMECNNSEKWLNAIKEELKSMDDNKVWELIELLEGSKRVGCKWVFKTKRDSKGNIERYKARLVAKGYIQKDGIDYKETFSPVSKKDSLRIVMPLVAYYDLELHQMDVIGYSDSDYAGCVYSRKSTFGYLFLLAGEGVSWKSGKQSVIATSTMEAEFVACFEATIHGLWLRNFISGFGVVDSIARPMGIFCDNFAAVFFSKNDKYSKGAKHMDLKYLSVKKEVQKRTVSIEHIGTDLMVADPLTKGLPPKTFVGHVERMGLIDKSLLA